MQSRYTERVRKECMDAVHAATTELNKELQTTQDIRATSEEKYKQITALSEELAQVKSVLGGKDAEIEKARHAAAHSEAQILEHRLGLERARAELEAAVKKIADIEQVQRRPFFPRIMLAMSIIYRCTDCRPSFCLSLHSNLRRSGRAQTPSTMSTKPR